MKQVDPKRTVPLLTLLHLGIEVASFVFQPLSPRLDAALRADTVLRLSVASDSGEHSARVSRINLTGTQPNRFRGFGGAGQYPFIVSGTWNFEDEERESWCEELVGHLSGEDVEFQLQKPDGSYVLQGVFEEFLDCVYDSSHDASYLLFDENLLSDLVPKLLEDLVLPEAYFGKDLFPLFPEPLRPKASCLVAGGRASRSKLHADPFDWVGWNYCFEGSKLWTFFPPQPEKVERELGAYRVEPNSWDSGTPALDALSIAAGRQSDVDIYRCLFAPKGHSAKSHAPPWPSARALSELSRSARHRALHEVEAQAAARVPLAAWRTDNAPSLDAGCVHVGVQREGEMVLIPPGWWHQTYHLEPSIAVASQYTNAANLPHVLGHVADWTGIGGSVPLQHEGLSAEEQVQELLHAVIRARYEEAQAAELLQLLFE